MDNTLLEYLKQGMEAQEALDLTKADYLSDSAVARYFKEQGYDNQINYMYAHDLQQLLEQSGQIAPAVDTSQYQFVDYQPPTSTLPSYQPNAPADLSVIFPQAEDTGARSFNFEIHNTVELDGDKVGESVTNYQTRENAKSNGY